MGILLAIDTVAPRLQLALLRADGSVDTSVDDIAQGQAELIFPRIEALLARNGVSFADLTRIAVTTGPGSFTGLRIGLSAARGLGLARNIPVIESPFCDIALVARFAETAPAGPPPEATYVRDADAKPQEKFRVARQ
ncbi:MAG: tRNA (adenosine(37)-N6)-threonylcarbamoyltransferase complex dimerization subunit type 1 TsaB [Hyphomicrobiales bacterium]|nr:MAG: tRNA (adenosine(37)-N6)-threonylcarbamoyltransferase complex dimerization subunit type 1 TsaB [Hyphomicrobiales bacterium]